MLTNLLKDLGEIGVAIGGDGDMKVYSFLDMCCLLCSAEYHGKMSPLTCCRPDGLSIKYPQFLDVLNTLNVQPCNIFLLTV